LPAENLGGHPFVGFDHNLIVDVHDDGTVAERPHGVSEDITADGLDAVMDNERPFVPQNSKPMEVAAIF
jgi:hypothetical protein